MMGVLGNQNVKFIRKFRWTLHITDEAGKIVVPPEFVKVSARPSLSIEETEVNYLSSKSWISGKSNWNEMSVTYYETQFGANSPMWTLLQEHFDSKGNFVKPINKYNYGLIMYDGCGTPVEQWVLKGAWPSSIQWGELDHSSSEMTTLELTLRYSEVVYGDGWKMPEDWVIHNPISSGMATLEEFLGRTAISGYRDEIPEA